MMRSTKIGRRITSSVLVLAMMCTISNNTAHAFEYTEDSPHNSIVVEGNSVTFQNLEQLSVDESFVATVFDSQGNEAKIGISPLQRATWSNSQSYRVWYWSGVINAEFYMVVSNNRVISVSDRNITTFGGAFSQPRLTINPAKTRGQLDFIFTSPNNFIKGDCWLRGEVTGSNNKIKVTYKM